MESVFAEWSNAQLKEYIEENGGNPKRFVERQELVQECARLSKEVEEKVLKASSRTPAGDKYPAAAAAGAGMDSKYPSAFPGGGSSSGGEPSKYPSLIPDHAGTGGSSASGDSRYPAAGAPATRGLYDNPYGVPAAASGAPAYPGYPPAPAPAYPSYPPSGPPPGPPSYNPTEYSPWLPASGSSTAPAYPPAGAAPYPGVGAGPYSAAPPPGVGADPYPGAPPPYPAAAPYPATPTNGAASSSTSSYPGYPAGPPSAGPAVATGYPAPYGGGAPPPGRADSSISSSGSYPSAPAAKPPAPAATDSRYHGAPPAGAAYGGVPPAMPPAGGPKKKALLCGCNYFGTSAQLNGCINDAKCMEYLLKTKFGYRPENILLMVDNHTDPLRRPTRYNMMQGITWLMTGLKAGDSLFFHFSGHGSQQRDYTGEESDGMNETLCPCDFKKAGEIVDDEINRYLVNPLPTGVKLHAVVDACHSGSAFDLPFHATVHQGVPRWQSEYGYRPPRTHKGTAGGFCVQFGASKDSQVAADTAALSGTGVSTGAATYAFIQAIEHRSGTITYGQLLVSMHQTLAAATRPGGSQSMMGLDALLGSLLGGSTAGFRGQEPVLSSVYAFDLNYKFDM